MFFGGQRGLNRFFPDRDPAEPDAAPVVLTGLRLFNKPVAPGAPGSPLAKPITETRGARRSPTSSRS